MSWHLCCVHASGLVDFVNVPLIQINYEDYVVPEAADSVHSRHRDYETEEVIDDRVQKSVEEGLSWHMLNTLQAIVYI